MKRDPRVDPKPGDIIRFGGTFDAKFYEVLKHDSRMQPHDISVISDGSESQISLQQWRERTAAAEVIRCA